LLARAEKRRYWPELERRPIRRAQIEEVLLNAENPSLNCIALNNDELRQRLGHTPNQWQKIGRTMKDIRILDVYRRWKTLPNGRHIEEGPATWLYADTDMPRKSQIPKARVKRSDVEAQRHIEALQADVNRLEKALKDIVAIGQEHV
jgi:hypothetical protein